MYLKLDSFNVIVYLKEENNASEGRNSFNFQHYFPAITDILITF